MYKIALKYEQKKAEIELSYGSYDVFNPYFYNQPFAQVMGFYELSKYCKLQSYFRYEYDKKFFTPMNYFFSFGATFYV